MKMILFVELFLATCSVFTMQNDRVGIVCSLEHHETSNTDERKDRFTNFIRGEIEKILAIGDVSSTVGDINTALAEYGITLKIREQNSGSLACFVHGLVEAEDFDEQGFLTNNALRKIKSSGLSIDVNCKYSMDTRSFVIFKANKQELWCETPYCGNVMYHETARVYLREIGVTLCPFFVILFHELLHLKHFLDTINFQLQKLADETFIPYGKAISIKGKDDYDNKLTQEQRKAFGYIAEFDDDIFVKALQQDLKAVAKNDQSMELSLQVINADKAYELSKKLSENSKEYLWEKKHVRLDIIEKLAAKPDWENLEEVRTVFGSEMDLVNEDLIRKSIGMPPRGVYGIPQCKRYVLNSTISKRYKENIDREYSIGMSSQNMTEAEAEYAPLIVRLLSCRNQVILKHIGGRTPNKYAQTIELVREALCIKNFDPDMEVVTPTKAMLNDNSTVDMMVERITPEQSSTSEDDS